MRRLTLLVALIGLVACADPPGSQRGGPAVEQDTSNADDTSADAPDADTSLEDTTAGDAAADVDATVEDTPPDAEDTSPDADPTDVEDISDDPSSDTAADLGDSADEPDAMVDPDHFAVLSLNLHCLELGGTPYTDHAARFGAIAELVASRGVVAIAIQEACDDGTLNALDMLEAAVEATTGEPWSSTFAFAHTAWEGTAREASEGVAILGRGALTGAGSVVHRVQMGLRRVMAWASVETPAGPLRLVSVHFDHQNAEARLAQAREAAALPLAISAPGLGVVVAGDFNASADSPAPRALEAMGYRNLARGVGQDSSRIDHVFAHRGAPLAVVSKALVFNTTQTRVSDHPGVLMTLRPASGEPVTVTRMIARRDVGFGNTVSVRGGLAPLSWELGWPAHNAATDRWEFVLTELPAGETVPFKFLLNDATWQTGDDLMVRGGEVWEGVPPFP